MTIQEEVQVRIPRTHPLRRSSFHDEKFHDQICHEIFEIGYLECCCALDNKERNRKRADPSSATARRLAGDWWQS